MLHAHCTIDAQQARTLHARTHARGSARTPAHPRDARTSRGALKLPRPCTCTVCARQLRDVWQPRRFTHTARPTLHAAPGCALAPVAPRPAHAPRPHATSQPPCGAAPPGLPITPLANTRAHTHRQQAIARHTSTQRALHASTAATAAPRPALALLPAHSRLVGRHVWTVVQWASGNQGWPGDALGARCV